MDEPLTPQSILNKSSEDKFLLVLNLPPIMKTIDVPKRANANVDLDKIQFSVEGSIIPPSTVPNVTVPFSGQNLEVTSYARTPWQKNRVKFTIDNRFNNYWVLWKWLNILNDSKLSIFNAGKLPDTGVLKSLHNYQTDISIFAKDEYNNNTAEFKYHKAFITELGGFEYDYQKSDQIKSSFEFAYSQFYMDLL